MDVATAVASIREDRNARASAEWLLVEAAYHLETGIAMPPDLARAVVDALEHLADTDPLSAFRHLYSSESTLGRPSKDGSKREQIEVFRQILHLHESRGLPYSSPGDRPPYKNIEGTVFLEFARTNSKGNEAAIRKEARRLQEAFRTHMDRLPAEQSNSLGYPSAMRRPLRKPRSNSRKSTSRGSRKAPPQ